VFLGDELRKIINCYLVWRSMDADTSALIASSRTRKHMGTPL
jgi:hypothetical protein